MKEEFLSKVKAQFSESDYNQISRALDFAIEAHLGQKRLSGEEYIVHPIAVAETLLDINIDSSAVIAGLFHDIVEDTLISIEQIKNLFGVEVGELVEGVTNLSKIKFNSKEEEQAENIRKLVLAMSKDIRVIVIKLADRLNNMRTLQFLPPEKQQRIARETMEIYAPIAGRIGISAIKIQLEDLAMKYLYPEDYNELVSLISSKREDRMALVEKVSSVISEELAGLGIKGEVKGRPKHLYSIYKKMKNQEKTIDQIYDLIAVRVIVDTVRDCYTVLGVIHSMWKPIPGRFKDYIAVPKPNLYQSLHTTVVTNYGQVFEIQIRTYKMNEIAEYGIAAHWKYKEGVTGKPIDEMDNKLGWIRQAMEVDEESKDSIEFLNALKINFFSDLVFVFTPKGDVFDLPQGSTPVDFAYNIHSAIGNKCVGAKINNKIMPLSTVLKTGDVVEIMTSGSAKGPNLDWLKFVKTSGAKSKIKAFLKKINQVENIKLGHDMLERESKRRGYNMVDLMQPDYISYVLKRYNLNSVDDLYASVGYGGTSTNQVLFKLIQLYKEEQKAVAPVIEKTDQDVAPIRKKSSSGILVHGFADFLIHIAHCCNPVPGDEIIGYISRGRGVAIHSTDCPNVKNFESERCIEAQWDTAEANAKFIAGINLVCKDKSGLLAQITNAIANRGFSIVAAEVKVKNAGEATVSISIEINNVDELNELIKKLRSIEGIIDIQRKR